MADSAAARKREERRARLLANSKERMNRIHGVTQPHNEAVVKAQQHQQPQHGEDAAPSRAAEGAGVETRRVTPKAPATRAAASADTGRQRQPTPVRKAEPPSAGPVTATPTLAARMGAVVQTGDAVAAGLGLCVAGLLAGRAPNLYEDFALGMLSSPVSVVVPFAAAEIVVNGAGLDAKANPLAILWGSANVIKRFMLYLFVFLVTIECIANRLA